MNGDLKIKVREITVETTTVVEAHLTPGINESDPGYRHPLLEVYEITTEKPYDFRIGSKIDEASVKVIQGAGVTADEFAEISEQLAQAIRNKYDHGGIAPCDWIE